MNTENLNIGDKVRLYREIFGTITDKDETGIKLSTRNGNGFSTWHDDNKWKVEVLEKAVPPLKVGDEVTISRDNFKLPIGTLAGSDGLAPIFKVSEDSWVSAANSHLSSSKYRYEGLSLPRKIQYLPGGSDGN